MKLQNKPMPLKAEGRFSVSRVKDGAEISCTPFTDNVVTYEGAKRLFFDNSAFYSSYAKLGTGTTERDRNSLDLGNKASATSSASGSATRSGEVDNLDGTSTITLTKVMSFDIGDLVGTFSEVGLYDNSTGTGFLAGQLIKDELNAPTTITVLADEQVVVTYVLELTVPNGGLSIQPTVSTGTVTTPQGTSNFTMYQQPYFAAYDIGHPSNNSYATRAYIYALDSNGDSGNRFPTSGTSTVSLGASGVVTETSQVMTAAPSDFTQADISYILFGSTRSGFNAFVTAIDPVTKRKLSQQDNRAPIVIEFDPPLNKTASDTLSLQLEVQYQV